MKTKIEFQKNCFVGSIDLSEANTSQEKRIETVTNIASICYGRFGTDKTPEQRLKMYNRLAKEANNNYSTAFEFVSVRIQIEDLLHLKDSYRLSNEIFDNKILKYSYGLYDKYDCLDIVLTNMRTLLKVGIKEGDIPFNTAQEVAGFTCIAGKIPFKCMYHIDRSRAFVFNEETSRNKKYLKEIEFIYPDYWSEHKVIYQKNKDIELLNELKFNIDCKFDTPEDANMELSARRLVKFAMAAWIQDENSFKELIGQRSAKNTQNLTAEVVNNISKLV